MMRAELVAATACLFLGACGEPLHDRQDSSASAEESASVAPPPMQPPRIQSASPDPFSAPASAEALGPPPQVRCTLSSIRSKIAMNKTAGFPNLECQWRSAEQRFWGRKEPTAKLSVALHNGANVQGIVREMRATRWEQSREDPSLYYFQFASTDDAIDAIRPLICHPQVIGASMVLLISAQDDEEMDAWCEQQEPAPAQ